MIPILLNLFTFIFLSNFYILQISTESLHDFPWSVDKGNWIITAKLISSSDEVYDIREYVHSSEVVRGKITISSGNDKLDIFYSSEFENDRLVIQNQQCTKFTFKNQWDNFLFNIDSKKPLLNHVLLTGPSILFRINGKSLNWRKGGDTNIRGFPVHSAKTTFNRNLDIIYYYKTHLDSPGILQASRLQFEGMDSSLQLVTFRENVNLDIYSITKTQEELDKFVTVTPGIGCPLHLITSKSHDWFQIPGMSWLVNYHFVATTTVYGPKKSKTLSEMFVNSEYLTTSLKTIEQGIITESLYDYNLGTVHVSLSKGRCLNSGVGPNSPGISTYGTFSSAGFLNYDYVYEYSYLGKESDTKLMFGKELITIINLRRKYDKFVTSHYFVSSADAKLFKGFILVKTKTNNYKKVNNSTYQFIESITKDYYGLEAESEVELSLRFSDCYPDSTDRKTFEIYFTCKEAADLDCVKYAENHFNEFIANAKKALAGKNISSGRIVNIDLSFKDRDIIVSVTFLKIPNIEDSVFKERIKLSKNTISSSSQVSAESVGECLHKQAGFYLAKEVIIFCDAEDTRSNICGRLQSAEKVVQENAGTICDVYYPVNSFFLFKKEIDLENWKIIFVVRHYASTLPVVYTHIL
ncbi:uncharacterized protein LOC128390954 [Panonychus citri]|uniref:uncharacterized protein LOC128390954 n=1 Tax=Panonychus citri TaxID=50023 RepID=UPI00230760A3|nr:uncharacterized protein LOC128390954 [Panonychus citri]